MKSAYVKPIMMFEGFQPTEYVAACYSFKCIAHGVDGGLSYVGSIFEGADVINHTCTDDDGTINISNPSYNGTIGSSISYITGTTTSYDRNKVPAGILAGLGVLFFGGSWSNAVAAFWDTVGVSSNNYKTAYLIGEHIAETTQSPISSRPNHS